MVASGRLVLKLERNDGCTVADAHDTGGVRARDLMAARQKA